MEAVVFLRDVVRIRKGMIKRGVSMKPASPDKADALYLIKWLEMSPKATERGALVMMGRFPRGVEWLLPGERCKAHKKFIERWRALQPELIY